MGHILSPLARLDLENIWDYIAIVGGDPMAADRLIDAIAQRFILLARNPGIGRTRDEDLRVGLRSFPVGDFVIFYRTNDADVVILRVLHGRRDLKSLFDP